MNKIIKICPVCYIEFSINKCHESRYITCGHKCGGILRKKPIITNNCLHCSKQFISKKHPTQSQDFCSHICSSQSRSNKIERTCLSCAKIFHISPHKLNKTGGGTYCTQSCRLNHWNIQSLNKQMPGSYRQNAWKVFDKKCYDCGITDERVLVIHHIDGNRKNGLISNLIPVCHNCHCIRHINLSGDGRLPSYRGRD